MNQGRAEGVDARGPEQGERAAPRLPRAAPADAEGLLASGGADLGPVVDVAELASRVKAELRQRFELGQSAAAMEYLDRYSILRADADRVLSLVYEEYCLRTEHGKAVDLDSFLRVYAPWRDSIESQLRYHRAFSQLVLPETAAPRFPALGEDFEHFRVVAELGRGGAARVYLAEDRSLAQRQVVLKVSHDRGTEHEVLAKLRHDHIVPVLSVVTQASTQLRGLCLEYRPGLALDEVIRRLEARRPCRTAAAIRQALESDPTPPPLRTATVEGRGAGRGGGEEPTAGPLKVRPEAPGWAGFPASGSLSRGVAWIGARLAEALHHAHGHDIYHRDVKPANVLLTYDAGPQLLDFNLAHAVDSASQADAALRGGTLPYMAPEHLEAFLNPERWDRVGARADIYSLGLLLREMVTGRPPDAPDPRLSLARAIRELLDGRPGIRARLRESATDAPFALEAVIDRCLAYDPSDRYASAADLAADLLRVAGRRPLLHARNPSRGERVADWWHRTGRPLAVAALGVTLLGAAVGLAANRERLLVPVERRGAFASAVAAIRSGQPADAVALLDPLAQEAPSNALVQFYRGLANSQLRRPETATLAFGTAFGSSDRERMVRDDLRRHPELVDQTAQAGLSILSSAPARPRGRRERQAAGAALATADRLLDLALAARPGIPLALQGKANIAERRGDYESASRFLDEAIERSSAPQRDGTGRLPDERLAGLYALRARSLLRLVQASDANRDQPAGRLLDDGRFSQVFADLDRSNALDRKGRWRQGNRCILGTAQYRAALLLERDGKPGEALSLLREADRNIALVLPYVEDNPELAAMRDKIRENLRRLAAGDRDDRGANAGG